MDPGAQALRVRPGVLARGLIELIELFELIELIELFFFRSSSGWSRGVGQRLN